jgi:hypothetical protein
MPTILLSESCIAELKAALAATQSPDSGQTPGTDAPPVQPPPSADGTIAGYDRVLRHLWDWSDDATAHLNTNSMGGIGPNGLVIIEFVVPRHITSGIGNVSVTAYPGDLQPCERICSISVTPGNFSQPFPWTRTGSDTGIQFVIGESNRFAPGLTPGGRYYINLASPGCAYSGRACDMIIQMSKPQ